MPSNVTNNKANCDILIFGTGIAGLTIAEKLTGMGLKVILVEKQKHISSGATTRSGDLVHAGGFHSALIADEERAMNTGYHCARGSEIILADCPEGIWNDATPVHLAVCDDEIADRTIQRWQTLGIKHKQVSREDALSQISLRDFNPPSKTKFFETEDKPFNWRLYCDRKHQQLVEAGVRFLLEANMRSRVGNTCTLAVAGTNLEVSFNQAIHATGYGILQSLKQHGEFFDKRVEVELWKSLSLVTRRCNSSGFLFVDPMFPSFMPSGNSSIINVSQLDSLSESDNFDIDPQQPGLFEESLRRVGLNSASFLNELGHYQACLKPNINTDKDVRKVDVLAVRMSSADILALPGKATASPILADAVVNILGTVSSNIL